MSWEPIRKHAGRMERHEPGIFFNEKSPSHISAGLQHLLKPECKGLTFFAGTGDDSGEIAFQQDMEITPTTYKLIQGGNDKRMRISCMKVCSRFKLNKIFVEFKKEGDRYIGKLPTAQTPSDDKPRSPVTAIQSPQAPIPAEVKKPTRIAKAAVRSLENTQTHPVPPTRTEPPPEQLLEQNHKSGKRDLLIIRFGTRPMCRISKRMGEMAGEKKYIQVTKTAGQKELRAAFVNKPGDGAFGLRPAANGIQFSCAGFIRLHSLADKTIEFEHDPKSGFFYGDIL